MRDDFLVFGQPDFSEEAINELVTSLRARWVGTGPKVKRFEEEFAAYKGVEHAVALGSCTAALHLSLLVAGIKPGDEVITTPMTFCATVNAIIHAGGKPVLADVDASQNIDPERIAEAITPRTKAIVPVHFAGRSCDMDPIMDLAEDHDLQVIEDAAHAVETEYKGRKAGTDGQFGCFSFYATKNVSTAEGGMVVTRDAEAADRLRRLGLHGMSKDAWNRFGGSGYKHYQVVEPGFKYNMTDLQAALGIHQLAAVEAHWLRRQAIWDRYQEAFAGLPIERPLVAAPQTRHAYHLYTLLVEEQDAGIERDAFMDRMTKQNIGVGVHYLSIPEHPYYREAFGWRPEQFPQAMRIGRNTLSLPLSPYLNDRDVADVIEAVEASAAP